MNDELNERELEQLERELRSYGDPYAAPEPDERYFANFRARVLERVSAETEIVGLGARIKEFFFGSPLRMTFAGASLVAATLLYFYLQSGIPTQEPIAQDRFVQEKAAPEGPQTVAPITEEPVPVVQAPAERSVTGHRVANKVQHQEAMPPVKEAVTPIVNDNSANVADAASTEFDQIDELSLSDESEPVSYDRLSVDELEAVLKTLESEPLTIQ